MFTFSGNSCSTKDSTDSSIKDSPDPKTARCEAIFNKYASTNDLDFSFEVVAVQDNSCMVSEVLDEAALKSPERRMVGNRIFTVDLETNEVRQFPVR